MSTLWVPLRVLFGAPCEYPVSTCLYRLHRRVALHRLDDRGDSAPAVELALRTEYPREPYSTLEYPREP